jgi:hypothetical protein
MKKTLYKFLFLLAIPFFLGACADNDHYVTLNSESDITVTVSSSVSTLTLLKDNIGQDALTISWSEPDYGVNTQNASFELLADLASGDFSTVSAIVSTGDLEKVFEVEELNKLLLSIELTPDEAVTIQLKVIARIGQKITESNIITVDLTPYADKLDLSSAWGLVGDATPNGWGGPDVPFYKTGTANEYVAYPTLIDGFFKVRKDNDWTVNYGDATLDGVLDTDNDNNIAVTAGTYKVTFNESTLAYSIEAFTWGLVGDATPGGWIGPDLPLTYDSNTDTWKAIVNLLDGQIKIRQNNDWAVNYGDATLDGVLDGDNDNNIVVTAGNYLVTVNTTTLEYTLEAIDVWGIVGDATPNSWTGPDTKFKLDYSQEGVWYLNNITLTDGAIKFRTNDDWGLNYGDATLDGVLDGDNDNNIIVTAGVYSFTLDFSDTNSPKYTMTKN